MWPASPPGIGTVHSVTVARCARANARIRAAVRFSVAWSSCDVACHAASSSTSRRSTSGAPGVISPNCSAYRRSAGSPSVRIASTIGSATARAFGSTGSRRISGTSAGLSRLSFENL